MIEARREIKSMIYRKFDTEKECAERLGWPKQKLNKIVNGKQEPSVSEAVAIAAVMEEPVGRVVDIFLKMTSPNG